MRSNSRAQRAAMRAAGWLHMPEITPKKIRETRVTLRSGALATCITAKVARPGAGESPCGTVSGERGTSAAPRHGTGRVAGDGGPGIPGSRSEWQLQVRSRHWRHGAGSAQGVSRSLLGRVGRDVEYKPAGRLNPPGGECRIITQFVQGQPVRSGTAPDSEASLGKGFGCARHAPASEGYCVLPTDFPGAAAAGHEFARDPLRCFGRARKQRIFRSDRVESDGLHGGRSPGRQGCKQPAWTGRELPKWPRRVSEPLKAFRCQLEMTR